MTASNDFIRPLADPAVAVSDTIPSVKPFYVLTCMEFIHENHAERTLFLLDALGSLGYKLHIQLKGEDRFKQQCKELKERYGRQVTLIENKKEIEKSIKKADVYFSAVMPEKNIAEDLIGKGIVPVVPNGGTFINFDPQNESGNAFTFDEGNFWQMMEAMIRARETRKFSYDWRNIRQSVRQTVV